jgi:hypothetical protein
MRECSKGPRAVAEKIAGFVDDSENKEGLKKNCRKIDRKRSFLMAVQGNEEIPGKKKAGGKQDGAENCCP